jgi:signal transduction histidine kinase
LALRFFFAHNTQPILDTQKNQKPLRLGGTDKAAQEQSEQALLISEVAHNLRQSTASIEMMLRTAESELSRNQIPGALLQAKYIRMANHQNERLAAQLSALAGIHNRTDLIPRSMVDLRTVLERTRTFTEPHLSVQPKLVTWRFQHLEQGAYVALSHGDELTAVLIQLVENAIKYAADPGTGRQARVVVRVIKQGLKIKISVMDNGPGIPEDAVDRIWAPHVRLKRNHPDIAGSGLGLYIVRNLVSRLDGHDISVHSRYGVGTRFDLTVPDARPFLQLVGGLCQSDSVVEQA